MKAARWVWRGLVRKRSSNVTFAGWLPYAEIELSALDRQCLSQRLPSLELAQAQVAAWTTRRNQQHVTIDWRFTAEDASIKLKHLYPSLKD